MIFITSASRRYREMAGYMVDSLRRCGHEEPVVCVSDSAEALADGVEVIADANWTMPYDPRWRLVAGRDWSAHDWVVYLDADCLLLNPLAMPESGDLWVSPAPPDGRGLSAGAWACRGWRAQQFARDVLAHRQENVTPDTAALNLAAVDAGVWSAVTWVPEQAVGPATVIAHLHGTGAAMKRYERLRRRL